MDMLLAGCLWLRMARALRPNIKRRTPLPNNLGGVIIDHLCLIIDLPQRKMKIFLIFMTKVILQLGARHSGERRLPASHWDSHRMMPSSFMMTFQRDGFQTLEEHCPGDRTPIKILTSQRSSERKCGYHFFHPGSVRHWGQGSRGREKLFKVKSGWRSPWVTSVTFGEHSLPTFAPLHQWISHVSHNLLDRNNHNTILCVLISWNHVAHLP